MRESRKPKKEPSKQLQYLGKCISKARKGSGLTQQELADQCHRGLRHIQNIEAGIANPSYEVLYDLVHRLGTSADILFFPTLEQSEEEVRHLLSKITACTEDERQIILKTLDCLAEQFLNRRSKQPREKE